MLGLCLRDVIYWIVSVKNNGKVYTIFKPMLIRKIKFE